MTIDDIQNFQTILNINNAIINRRTREGLFREISNVLEPVFHFDRISILINQPGENSWHYFSPARGTAIPGLPTDKLPIIKGMIPYEAMSTRSTIIVDVPKEPQFPEAESLIQAGLVWMICTPLVNRNRVVGSLQLSYKNSAPLQKHEISLFEEVSQQIALAVDNMLAYEELDNLKEKLTEEKKYLKKEVDTFSEKKDIIFASLLMSRLLEYIKNVASTDVTVLISGETGTGKDLLAREIHKMSKRKHNTFVKVNCAALVPTLLESELFGHEKGAFTGANARRMGRFEIASGSTLFLDEISEIPMNTQAKLLQVLQEKKFERVGGSKTLSTDVRIIAASNQDLATLVKEKKFREDLYYRLCTFPIHVPALRERTEDIPLLVDHFVKKVCSELNRIPPLCDNGAIDVLMHYHWPGNIRELENFIERIIILKSNQPVTKQEVRSVLYTTVSSDKYEDEVSTLEAVEKKHIQKILKKTRGVVSGEHGAAKILGLKRPTLQYRIKKLEINPSDYRK